MTKTDMKKYLMKHGYSIIGSTERDGKILIFCSKSKEYFWLEVTENGVIEHNEIEIPPFPG